MLVNSGDSDGASEFMAGSRSSSASLAEEGCVRCGGLLLMTMADKQVKYRE
jgi:hypothetical protein